MWAERRPSPAGSRYSLTRIGKVTLEVNLLAAVRLDRAFIPGMIERKSGLVIHISSVSHRMPFSNSTLASRL
jgi:short-subunit dehydrogenase